MADPSDEAVIKKKSNTPLIAVVLLALGGGGAFFFMRGQKAPADGTQQAGHGGGDEGGHGGGGGGGGSGGQTSALQGFIVNLADSGLSRYLKLSISVELVGEKTADQLKANEAAIRDYIITLSSSLTTEDLRPPEGKLALRDKIQAKLSELLGAGKVKSIYFTDFVIQ